MTFGASHGPLVFSGLSRRLARRGPRPRAIHTVWNQFNNMVWPQGARRACGGHSGTGEDDQRVDDLAPLFATHWTKKRLSRQRSPLSNMARRVLSCVARSQVAGEGKAGLERPK